MLHQGVTATNKRTPSWFLLRGPVFSYHEQCSKIAKAVNQSNVPFARSSWIRFKKEFWGKMLLFNLGIPVPVCVPCVVDQMEAYGVSQRLTSLCGCHRYWIWMPEWHFFSLKFELVYIYKGVDVKGGVKHIPHWTGAVSLYWSGILFLISLFPLFLSIYIHISPNPGL